VNNEKNIGLTKSLNKGLKLARGEYIARQDADDISLPERLEKEVLFLDQNKNIALVGTYYYMINEKSKILNTIKPLTKSEEIKNGLLKGNQFGHGSVMFRAECVKEVGYYREELGPAEDYDLWLRISDRYNMANIPEPLYKWRLNIKSVSIKKKALEDKYALLAIELAKERRQLGKDKLQSLNKKDIDKLLDELISDTRIQDKRKIAEGYCFWSRVLFGGKDYTGAFKLLFKSLVSYPLNKETWALAFKDLAILILPKPIMNILRFIKRTIF
jgi:glycosyltransferase involved in cell wall biosynthesis